MTNLKPCPFCGKEPVFHEDTLGDSAIFWTRCSGEDCVSRSYQFFDDKLDAIKQWNTRAPSAENQWQPIKTAPRDGKVVLLYKTGRVFPFTGSHFKPRKLFDDEGWWVENGIEVDPTHWMPLPKPPKSLEKP